MKLSIIMGTRDRPDWLPKAIASVLRQQDVRWELCVLDNGADSVEHLIPDDPRIIYRRHEAAGVADAYEQARHMATGDVVMPLADDDELYPAAVGSILEGIGGHWWGYACTDFVRNGHVAFVLGAPWSMERMRTHYYLGGAVFWRRDLPERCGGGFDPAWEGVPDYDLYLRFGEYVEPLYIPITLYRYHEWEGTSTLRFAQNAADKSALLHVRPARVWA